MRRRESRLPTLGARGEGWVIGQFLLLGAVAGSSLPALAWPAPARTALAAAGFALCAAGASLVLLGAAALGRSLTPLPRPHAQSALCRRGIYRSVRHPIYGGLAAVAVGWSLAAAPLALPASALLVVLLELKSRVEERWLEARYADYAAYRAATPGRLFPRPF